MISAANIDPYLSHAIEMCENLDETPEETLALHKVCYRENLYSQETNLNKINLFSLCQLQTATTLKKLA